METIERGATGSVGDDAGAERAEIGFGRAASLFVGSEAAPVHSLVTLAEQFLPALLTPLRHAGHAGSGNQLLVVLANTEGTIARLRELRVPLRKQLGATFDHEAMRSLDVRCRLAARILDAASDEAELSPPERANVNRLLQELPQAALRISGFGFAVYPAVALAMLAAVGVAALCRQGPSLKSTLQACRSYFAGCLDPNQDGSLGDNAEVCATAAGNLLYAMEGVPKFGFLAEEEVGGQWRTRYGVVSGNPEMGYAGRVETETGARSNPRGWVPFPGFGAANGSLDPLIAHLNRLRTERIAELADERILRRHCEALAGLVREIDKVLARL
ncbi:MAG: hypothetical protein ACM3IK_11770 [Sphingomonadaceae bacterium]